MLVQTFLSLSFIFASHTHNPWYQVPHTSVSQNPSKSMNKKRTLINLPIFYSDKILATGSRGEKSAAKMLIYYQNRVR